MATRKAHETVQVSVRAWAVGLDVQKVQVKARALAVAKV